MNFYRSFVWHQVLSRLTRNAFNQFFFQILFFLYQEQQFECQYQNLYYLKVLKKQNQFLTKLYVVFEFSLNQVFCYRIEKNNNFDYFWFKKSFSSIFQTFINTRAKSFSLGYFFNFTCISAQSNMKSQNKSYFFVICVSNCKLNYKPKTNFLEGSNKASVS